MKIQFPVLTISKSSHLNFVRNKEDLQKCNKRALKKGYHNGLIIISSDAKKYRIQGAIKQGTVGILWGFNIFRGQQLKVKLIYQKEVEDIELNKFQNLLVKIMKRDDFFWDSDGQLKERIEFIKTGKSIKEIIVKLTDEYYKEY